MKAIYLVVGVPGSGKSWVCSRLSEQFHIVQNDDYIETGGYPEALIAGSNMSRKPVLGEAPFSISKITELLEAEGFTVIPVFILEDEDVLISRYEQREGRDIPKGHLSRQRTYRERAEEMGAFMGTSEEVLKHFLEIAAMWRA